MTGQEFGVAIQKKFIDDALDDYREKLRTIPRDIAKNLPRGPANPWGYAIHAWDTMNDEQRDGFLQFARLVMVDTISEIFAVFDNATVLNNWDDQFFLLYGPYDSELSKRPDRLQAILDYFLEAEEMKCNSLAKPHSLWPPSNDPCAKKKS